jgi:hypothetical protein
MTENERFGLVFVKTRSIKFGQCIIRIRNTGRKVILPAAAIHVYGGESVGAAVIVQDHGGLVAVLPQVQLQGVAVLRGIPTHTILVCLMTKETDV